MTDEKRKPYTVYEDGGKFWFRGIDYPEYHQIGNIFGPYEDKEKAEQDATMAEAVEA